MVRVGRKALALGLLSIPVIGVLASNPASASTPVCLNTDTPSSVLPMPDFESSVVCLINQQRAASHERPLRPNWLLRNAAEIYVSSLLSGEFFTHHGGLVGDNNTSTAIGRLRELGYIPPGKRWIVGEDLREANPTTATPAGVVHAWMISPPHRQRILKAKFEDIGIGASPGVASQQPPTLDGVTVVAEFGFRRPPR